jgi:fumarate reductase iron-sulfur subunit
MGATAAAAKTITIILTRFAPEADAEPRVQSFTIPYTDDMVVLDALNEIKDRVDGSVTYRWSCRMGVCGSCGMNVNGVPRLACATFLKDLGTDTVTIEPLANFPVVRDLVVDMSDFMEKLKSVKPWLIRKDPEPGLDQGERRQSPEELEAYKQFSMCINCMLCYAACPVYGLAPAFTGPAALALGQRYNLDSRDQGAEDRKPTMAADAGIWECTYVGECTVVCPKHVDPAAAIQRAKVQTVADWWRSVLMPWMKPRTPAGTGSGGGA